MLFVDHDDHVMSKWSSFVEWEWVWDTMNHLRQKE